MTETFAEATARLRREIRLSQQIAETAEYLDVARKSLGASLGYMFTGPQLAVLVDQLRELRARRVAMQREPDDEVNAAADLATCERCGRPATCQGRQERAGSSGACCDEHCAHDHAAGCEPAVGGAMIEVLRVSPSDKEVLALCAQLEHHRETLRMLAVDNPGLLREREPWLFEAAGETPPKPECTGVSARWCPVHGECTCTAEPWNEQDLNEPDCPLHGTASDHAEAPPDPEAIARRLLGELGPEVAAAVCVQLLGRLPRRGSEILG